MNVLCFLGVCSSTLFFTEKTDTIKIQNIEVLNFTKKLPITQEIIKVNEDLTNKNLGQDLPILLKNQTSFLSSSDAGNGIGYTDFRIRGIGGNSINFTINGVPYNDSESHGTFFVNIPDFTSSASEIIIQKGAGTSTNGVSSFGASVNILTKDPTKKPYFLSNFSYGSFNSQKQAIEAGSGVLFNNSFYLMTRYSQIKSDGYIDRAFSRLKSYNITALLKIKNTQLKYFSFGGKEKTYQAWNGIDEKTYLINRKMNFSGAIYDENNNIIDYYDNETDNYWQNHHHFIFKQKLNTHWSLENTLHYTKGKGFYENYRQKQFYDFINTDFIEKKWLSNDFYGMMYHIFGNYKRLKLHFSGAGNQYIGHHFGNIRPFLLKNNEYEYYRNKSKKNDFSTFWKMIYFFNKLELFADVQLRHIHYKANIILDNKREGGNFDRVFNFVNPKTGLNYNFKQGRFYFFYALAHREPNRTDILSKHDISQEKLHDFELGFNKKWNNTSVTANIYYMYYLNQLVFSGKIDNTGAFIRSNSGKSYRQGIEIVFKSQFLKNWLFSANANFSQNKNINYTIKKNKSLKRLGNTSIALSPSLITNMNLSYKVTPWFNISLQSQHVGKQYLNNTQNKKLAIPRYSILDVNTSYHISFKHYELDLHLNLNNILNEMYVNKGYVYEQMPYYFPQAGRNFMIGMNFKIH